MGTLLRLIHAGLPGLVLPTFSHVPTSLASRASSRPPCWVRPRRSVARCASFVETAVACWVCAMAGPWPRQRGDLAEARAKRERRLAEGAGFEPAIA